VICFALIPGQRAAQLRRQVSQGEADPAADGLRWRLVGRDMDRQQAQSMLGLAGRLLGSRREVAETLSTAGVTVDADGQQAARIAITVTLRAGYNCRDTAEAIQTQVRDHITRQTGLAAIVTVTITDIEFDHNAGEHTAQPPGLRVIRP